jgi:tRNA(fMet)-specific endonuclease VapC
VRQALVDTDILSEVLKGKASNVAACSLQYLKIHGHFTVSAMTRYELLRGLKEKNATTISIRGLLSAYRGIAPDRYGH